MREDFVIVGCTFFHPVFMLCLNFISLLPRVSAGADKQGFAVWLVMRTVIIYAYLFGVCLVLWVPLSCTSLRLSGLHDEAADRCQFTVHILSSSTEVSMSLKQEIMFKPLRDCDSNQHPRPHMKERPEDIFIRSFSIGNLTHSDSGKAVV
ncbi:unnamed protein product [Citrullus colocynthis]|uniref:Uncharacterized protein n=1 Tax=Citrullus colocynthis TaxID=252529 RepID=A0ABP0Y366_9ROSI